MRPVSSQARQLPPVSEAANPADRELLVDIELFDTQGNWNPRNVVFCAAGDPARAKKLSTRCFRGLMAWYGKLWATNYLSSHFKDKPESNELLNNIKKSGFVDNKAFKETVVRCTLLYEDLEQAATGKSTQEHLNIIAPSIIDIDKVVSEFFLQVDWRQCADDKQFEQITLEMAHNIKYILGELKQDKYSNEIVNKLQAFMVGYQNWYQNPPAIKKENSELHTKIVENIEAKKYDRREKIASIIFDALKEYDSRSPSNQVIREKFLLKKKNEKNEAKNSELFFWSLSAARSQKKTISRTTVVPSHQINKDHPQINSVAKSGDRPVEFSLPSEDIENMDQHFFLQFDWKRYAEEKQFEWITIAMANKIKHLLNALKPDKKYEEIVANLESFMHEYQEWLANPPETKKSSSNLLNEITEGIEAKKYEYRQKIAHIVLDAIDEYHGRPLRNEIFS